MKITIPLSIYRRNYSLCTTGEHLELNKWQEHRVNGLYHNPYKYIGTEYGTIKKYRSVSTKYKPIEINFKIPKFRFRKPKGRLTATMQDGTNFYTK